MQAETPEELPPWARSEMERELVRPASSATPTLARAPHEAILTGRTGTAHTVCPGDAGSLLPAGPAVRPLPARLLHGRHRRGAPPTPRLQYTSMHLASHHPPRRCPPALLLPFPLRCPTVAFDSAAPLSSLDPQVGSIYEYNGGNPIFGVLPKENVLWAPILLFMAVTGFPMARGQNEICSTYDLLVAAPGPSHRSPVRAQSAYLFVKSVQSANAASERADKIDGY